MITELKPWYWRSLPLNRRTGSAIFTSLFLCSSNSGIATLLESPYPTSTDNPQLTRYSICAGAPRIVNGQSQLWTPVVGEVLPFLDQLRQRSMGYEEQGGQGTTSPPAHLPFNGGWLGWLGYDVAWEIEELGCNKCDALPFPVAFWYEPECFAILDHWEQILWLAASSPNALDELESLLEKPEGGQRGNLSPLSPPLDLSPRFCTSCENYEAAVNRVKKYIYAGDIFQANLSLRFETTTTEEGWAIYQALQKINPSPFASYWQTPWGEVISCSPERLVQLQNQEASSRPIAGTRPRGVTLQEDRQLAVDLLANTKERAEHIMLVDLERNDLGRVCEWGTVIVDELLTIERYSHVMHLVSNIKGTLRCECTPVDLIRAVFPGGTITGCPKVRCMSIIEELEPTRRSLFYGSCGYLDWRGNLDLNILIRTLLVAPSPPLPKQCSGSSHLPTPRVKTVWGQVGAGIVADSDSKTEWDESLHKAQAQLNALGMFLSQE
ncbi:MAG: anthranilate synthase component I [Cyanomargarita calcarea GSE-NOS-MK-12-04C]|jgi:para-aminobenzoate synthetase component 1|uniref:Anthranilate synthase component 1 n=1 Tax=Cyanomargarita calcarea GSE-NOS-MK-12-04C TaxID=2839659 RepID=A0A951USF8_9CYAN|nr:anthranilate synthase component I [Cyanomargarita calcarea GSE-NOS-MK-12-04C]